MTPNTAAARPSGAPPEDRQAAGIPPAGIPPAGSEAAGSEAAGREAAGRRAAGRAAASIAAAGAPPAPPAPRPLWRNGQFQLLWAGQSASTLGRSVADVAYPLAILALTGSPGQAGVFAAVQAAAAVAGGLPGGHLADRFSWRRIVVTAEAAQAVVTAGVVLALIAGRLSLLVLLAAAALLGAGQSVGATARFLLLRSAVAPDQLTRALAQDEVRLNGALLAGPPLGGGLYAIRALAHAVPFVFTAASFALSVLTALLIRIRPEAQPAAPEQNAGLPAEPPSPRSGPLEGITTLWHQPMLRAAALLIMIINTIGAGLELVVVVILRGQGTSPAMIGVALGAGAVGGLAGAPLVPWLHRLRPGVLLLAICLLLIPVVALLAVPAGPWWAAGLLFAAMIGVPSLRVLVDVLVFRQAPADQRGRVMAAVMTLIGLGVPAGVAATALLLQFLPGPVAMLILAGGLAAGVLACATRRVLWQARWPS
jgi:predicted MFS family arabinose efflux permease